MGACVRQRIYLKRRVLSICIVRAITTATAATTTTTTATRTRDLTEQHLKIQDRSVCATVARQEGEHAGGRLPPTDIIYTYIIYKLRCLDLPLQTKLSVHTLTRQPPLISPRTRFPTAEASLAALTHIHNFSRRTNTGNLTKLCRPTPSSNSCSSPTSLSHESGKHADLSRPVPSHPRALASPP